MKEDRPHHRKLQSSNGFKMINGQLRFFSYVERTEPVVSDAKEVETKKVRFDDQKELVEYDKKLFEVSKKNIELENEVQIRASSESLCGGCL
jgi:hypothetical protein